MENRPRDSQRSKIMGACEDFRMLRPQDCALNFVPTGGRSDWTLAARDLNAILGMPWVERYCAKYELVPRITRMSVYKSKHGSDNIQDQGFGSYINLSPSRLDKLELLRYVAQTLIPDDAAWHGPEFVRAFLWAIDKEVGSDAKQTMLQLMQLKKVRRRIQSKEVRERQRAKYEARKVDRAISRLQETLQKLED